MSTSIVRLRGADALFAGIAQGAVVTGATLPSGLKVPQIHKKNEQWMVFGKSLVLVYKENEFTKLS